MKKKLIGLLHLIVIILVILSPIIFDYRLVTIGLVLYFLQIKVFGGCVLTKWQYGSYETTFYYYLFKSLRLPVTDRGARIFANYILPPVLVAAIIIIQLILNIKPFLDL